MSRLHAVKSTMDEVARRFGAEPATDAKVPSEAVEGTPGFVIIESKGRRLVRAATWGFPRPSTGRAVRGGEPQRVGMVADLTNPMWEQVVVDPRYRCLIPMTHFANPDGVLGAKTRTWFSLQDQAIMAWAGFCRNIPGVGPVYAGMTTDANEAVAPTNDRMPVLLEPDESDRWLHGTIQDVIHFQFRPPPRAERMVVTRTGDAWRSGNPPPNATQMEFL